MKLLVISGLSGSGKSIALQALEDFGFYCVDNLPASLLPSFSEQMSDESSKTKITEVAVGIDARNIANDLRSFHSVLDDLKTGHIEFEVIFIEADDNALLKRFSETRRKHPLTMQGLPLSEAIEKERKLLSPISVKADLRIDTTHTNVHQLRSLILDRVAKKGDSLLALQFVSFAFKAGVPADADFVFDVRCLPNPHWDPKLRAFSGKDAVVIEFLEQEESVRMMCQDIYDFIAKWLSSFKEQNRSYMTIAIGCTGGQHRSVYVAETLASQFEKCKEDALVRHRELQ